jgi:hypothetical protein
VAGFCSGVLGQRRDERFNLTGEGGEELEYFVRHGADVWVYTQKFGKIRMHEITEQYRSARELVEQARGT